MSSSTLGTLEELFGSMDYCTCQDCQSALSPSAYLVDLLEFINLKKYDLDGNELPVSYEKDNPLDMLLERRPDIEHIQLTCENANTVLPYIDLVNEILEYYTVNRTLVSFEGYNVQDVTSEELLANPQFVNAEAYKILKDQFYPFDLPFNQPLEAIRLFYDYSKVKLHQAMEIFRVNENFDTHIGPDEPSYAWRQIYNEFLDISPEEYTVFADSLAHTLPVYFGENKGMVFDDLKDRYKVNLPNAKVFSRKTGTSYNELIELIKTQFINPNSNLIPKLEKLGIGFDDIKNFVEGSLSEVDFGKKIPPKLDISIYGGDLKRWLKDNYDNIMNLIVLTPNAEKVDCQFDKLELRYSFPDVTQNHLKEIDYWRLLLFIRLWKKLGWTIEETDKTISALYDKTEFTPPSDVSISTQIKILNSGLKDLLIKIAIVKKIKEKLDLNKKDSLVELLTVWSNIDTSGNNSLYKRLFLQSSILRIDRVFEENGYGEYLSDINEKITKHLIGIQAALNVTAQELSLILNDAGFSESSELTMRNISTIYRYSFLAKALKLKVDEFIALKKMSGINPFDKLEYMNGMEYLLPKTLQFIDMAGLIKQSNFKIDILNYLLQHEDTTSKASPSKDNILSLAKILKDGLVKIEEEYKVNFEDQTGEIVKSKMALVYENAVVDKFFGLLKGTTSYSVHYSHPKEELEKALKDISNKITYDHFRKQLTFQGVMTDETKNNFKTVPGIAIVFAASIQELYNMGQQDFVDFFEKYSKVPNDLKTLYDNYVASKNPNENERMSIILKDFLPSLKEKLKHVFIKQILSSSLGANLPIVNELLENQKVLYSVPEDTTPPSPLLHFEPAIEDFLKLESKGVSAQYFFASTAPGAAEPKEELISEGIEFTADAKDPTHLLPVDPVNPHSKIRALWKFYLEVPVNDNYNFYVETDKEATVKISIDEKPIAISYDPGNGIWQNEQAMELKNGKLYKVELEIAELKDKAILKWQTKGIGQDHIPVRYSYPYKQVQNFNHTYIRFLKAISILQGLGLKEKEIAFFGTNTAFQIDGVGFLNAIASATNPDGDKVHALFNRLFDLLQFVDLKASLNIKDETLVNILNDPNIKGENSETLLMKVTNWDKSFQEKLLNHFKWVQADLSDFRKIIRINEAFDILYKFGVPVTSLLGWTTNSPDQVTVHDMQSALRSRCEDDSVWLSVLQPISNQLRSSQRDALVSYILHRMSMSKNPKLREIDTSDKLYGYFLIDTKMDPCVKTSRIKQAISTAQLYIQRILMDKEEDVSPSSIKINQWQYMKRYDLWVPAKIIYYRPENWLYPELKLDKSSEYKDLEGEILQGDITDELAETALLNYLKKLDKISKLEICGIYLQETESGIKSDDILLHVFGRTNETSQQNYYYRRLEYNHWTPWEKVDLDIEGNPILPVVWNNRLFLFWLNVVKKASDNEAKKTASEDVAKKTPSYDVAKESVEVSLSWSEYYNNKWQPKTSHIDTPIKLVNSVEAGQFSRGNILISSYFDSTGLIISLGYKTADLTYFKIINEHSSPLVNNGIDYGSIQDLKYIKYYDDFKNKFSSTIFLKTGPPGTPWPVIEHDILEKTSTYNIISSVTLTSNVFEAPFFYQDTKHVFFVKPQKNLVSIQDHDGIWAERAGLDKKFEGEEQVFTPIWNKPDIDASAITGVAADIPRIREIATKPVVDPPPVDFSDKSVALDKVVSENMAVTFDGTVIGPLGSQYARLLYDKKVGTGSFETTQILEDRL